MTREDQIREVEIGFLELFQLAENSWSNIAIAAKARLVHESVTKLYRPVLSGRKRRPIKVGFPLAPPPPPPEPFEPVQVDEHTRWG